VVADASRAFVDAMGSTVLVAAAVAVVGALVALIWLPSRALAPTVDEETVDLGTEADLVLVD